MATAVSVIMEIADGVTTLDHFEIVSHRFLNKEQIEPWEHEMLDTFVETWRTRLYDIS